MILFKKNNLNIKKYFFFIAFTLIGNITFAQNYVTHIPNNGEIVTIQNWLVTKPLPGNYYTKGINTNELKDGFSKDFLISIGGEKSPKITSGNKFNTPDGKKSSFNEHTWLKPYLDLTNLFGTPSDVFTYLYAEFESDINQEVYLHIGSNDGCKIWINGDLVIEYSNGRSAEPSQNIKRINLKPGRNSLLFKLNQLGGQWGAYVQIYSLKDQKSFASVKERKLANSSKFATIIDTKVICKQPNRYIGWPTVTKTKSGKLLAVFSGNRDGHVCPYGITQMISSDDNGETWSEEKTINNTALDDRDAGILETKMGTWLVSWFTSLAFDAERYYAKYPGWERHKEKLNPKTIKKWIGNWTRRSTDKGETWEEPVKQLVTAPHGPIELNDGRLLYVGTATIDDEKCLAVEESKDDGVSWQLISKIAIPQNDSIKPYSEPHVVEMPDGKLLAMFRYNPKEKMNSFLRQSESYDGGKTWSTTKVTNIWGYPPHLLLLKNGWLLLSYGVRKVPYGERACISKDGGKSWEIENEILISMSESEDLGYPASVQLDDGSILTIYYQIDKAGEKTSLMQTRWKLKDN